MRKYIRLIFQGGLTILHRFPKIKKISKNPQKYSIEETWSYINDFFIRLNKKAFHQVFFIQGKENLPKGQALFVANHTSNMDPISCFTFFDRPIGFLAKKEILKMPLVGVVCKACFGTFLDREDLRSELKTFKDIHKLLDENKKLSYVVFPEGHRSKGPEHNVGEFHGGTFKLATKREIPIVPFAIYLPDRILNQKYHYKKYPVQVRFLKPLYYEDYENLTTAEIANIARNNIISALEEMKKQDKELVMSLNKYSLKKTEKVLLLS